MAFFGLKLGLDLEMRAAHPHQKFKGVPTPPGESDKNGGETLKIVQSPRLLLEVPTIKLK